MSAQLRSEIDKAIAANDQQHALTRQHAETHIASVMQNLEISQDRYRTEQSQDHQSQRQFDQFLESLWFSDMNLRTNDISASFPGTFQWMFNGTAKRPWSSFTEWLKSSDRIYWVQGKAGSGKTTLMKFIANDPRTRDLLKHSSPNNTTLIVSFYFWLSGSRLQRSLKGLLCSLSRQIMLDEENRILFDSISTETTILTKRSIHDWSDKELQHLLMRLIGSLNGPICIFLDGLDEFEQGDDMDNLLDLIEALSSLGKVKICVSSRPEPHISNRMSKYSRIRLQDLTANDIRICIRDSLHHARARYSPTAVDDERINHIVRVMTAKAEGVFLWVHYALSSLIRGMRNEDDFGGLLDRIEQLPSGVYQLYSQMWNRNEDQQRYHDEATTYFSYGDFYPLSVFELLVAMDSTLQGDYLENLKPHVASQLARRCQRLTNRIHTVCAGLLEVIPWQHTPSFDGSSVNSAVRDAESLAADSIIDEGSQSVTLMFFYESRIQFLHRTARDFLLETKDGLLISGQSVDSLQLRFRNVIRARTAAQLHGGFDSIWIQEILCEIGKFESDYESELLITIKRVLEHLSISAKPWCHIGYRKFWDVFEDFECTAARHGCIQYIRYFLRHKDRHISPYYRGLLLLHTILGLHAGIGLRAGIRHSSMSTQYLALISWLFSVGADILTNHVLQYWVQSPALAFLMTIIESDVRDRRLTRQITEVFQLFLPVIYTSSGEGILYFYCERGRPVYQAVFDINNQPPGRYVIAKIALKKLCTLTMNKLNDRTAFEPQCR